MEGSKPATSEQPEERVTAAQNSMPAHKVFFAGGHICGPWSLVSRRNIHSRGAMKPRVLDSAHGGHTNVRRHSPQQLLQSSLASVHHLLPLLSRTHHARQLPPTDGVRNFKASRSPLPLFPPATLAPCTSYRMQLARFADFTLSAHVGMWRVPHAAWAGHVPAAASRPHR